MANKFAESAKKSVASSQIMTGRTKISTEDVIRLFPNGVTINDFDLIVKNGDGDMYPVFAIVEDSSVFFNGGAQATKIVLDWINDFDGDKARASEELKACGGCRFRISQKKTKTGRTMTMYDVIE